MIEDDIKSALTGITPGPLRIVISSTCSAAWPTLVQQCEDQETGEHWSREIGAGDTAFVEKSTSARDNGVFGSYEDAPGRFKKTPQHDETMANAKLWAGAPDLLTRALSEIESLRAERDTLKTKVRVMHGEDCGVRVLDNPLRTVPACKVLLEERNAAVADARRLDALDALCEAYGFEDEHLGNRWMIDGPYRDIRTALDGLIDAAIKGEAL